MDIRITSKALDYIKKKGISSLAISESITSSCSVYGRPIVEEEGPSDKEGYDHYNYKGLEIYYDLNLPDTDSITIGYQKVNDIEVLVPGEDR